MKRILRKVNVMSWNNIVLHDVKTETSLSLINICTDIFKI